MMNPEMRQIRLCFWSSLIIADRSLALTSSSVALAGCLSTTGWTSALRRSETQRLRNGSKRVTNSAGTAPCRRWPKPTRSSRASHVFWTGWVISNGGSFLKGAPKSWGFRYEIEVILDDKIGVAPYFGKAPLLSFQTLGLWQRWSTWMLVSF